MINHFSQWMWPEVARDVLIPTMLLSDLSLGRKPFFQPRQKDGLCAVGPGHPIVPSRRFFTATQRRHDAHMHAFAMPQASSLPARPTHLRDRQRCRGDCENEQTRVLVQPLPRPVDFPARLQRSAAIPSAGTGVGVSVTCSLPHARSGLPGRDWSNGDPRGPWRFRL
jgi:hypothetical protein